VWVLHFYQMVIQFLVNIIKCTCFHGGSCFIWFILECKQTTLPYYAVYSLLYCHHLQVRNTSNHNSQSLFYFKLYFHNSPWNLCFHYECWSNYTENTQNTCTCLFNKASHDKIKAACLTKINTSLLGSNWVILW